MIGKNVVPCHRMIFAVAAHHEVWEVLFQLVALLAAALVIGMMFEKFGQSAILGYLVAGMLLGPGVFGVVQTDSGVPVIAELGVALLLFAIGLEFSARRLIRLGPAAIFGGAFQVTLTLGIAALISWLSGLDWRAAIALGAAVALSSTACVLRLLVDRAEMDAVHGRTALGILLLQDVAVVPLVLLVTMLSDGGGFGSMAMGLAKAAGLIIALVTSFFLLSKFILPRVMRQLSMARDRELLVLLAVVLAAGSALAAHALGLSPALGAFLAGMMLAESPFATQIRSDIGGLRIVFITLFFASVGMLGDPVWIAQNALPVIGLTLLILLGKAAIITGVTLAFKLPLRYAFATGIVLCQVGEFGVVIAGIAGNTNIISEEIFRFLVSSMLLTLFVTPGLIKIALPLGRKLQEVLHPDKLADTPLIGESSATSKESVLIIGFGPSGQRVAEELARHPELTTMIVDVRQSNIDLAHNMGYPAVVGDATNLDFLIHHGIESTSAVVITIPDQRTSMSIVESVKTLNEKTSCIVRARYHTLVSELERAGATIVIDEEYLTGSGLRKAVIDRFGEGMQSERKMAKTST